jgi:hypothetical protein
VLAREILVREMEANSRPVFLRFFAEGSVGCVNGAFTIPHSSCVMVKNQSSSHSRVAGATQGPTGEYCFLD